MWSSDLGQHNGMDDGRVHANDQSAITKGRNRMELENKPNAVMTMTEEWCKKNKMNIAVGKAQYAMLKGCLARDPIINFGMARVTCVL